MLWQWSDSWHWLVGYWLVHSCLALAGSTPRYSSAVLILTYLKSDWINQISEKGQSKVTFIKEVHCGQIWILKSEQFGRVSNTTTLEEELCWTLVWDRHKKLKPHIYNVLYEFGGFSREEISFEERNFEDFCHLKNRAAKEKIRFFSRPAWLAAKILFQALVRFFFCEISQKRLKLTIV